MDDFDDPAKVDALHKAHVIGIVYDVTNYTSF
jgi:hypothetical protein